MARVAVVGANGMLGHMACAVLAPSHEIVAFSRQPLAGFGPLAKAPGAIRQVNGVDALEPGALEAALDRVRPDIVLNCVGLIKQKPEAHDAILAVQVNALLPHRLAVASREWGGKLIQLSTDCVFSGRRGLYRETDIPDPADLYGRSKLLGEIDSPPHLTIRTSIIGCQLKGSEGLIEWFLSQRGKPTKGFRRAVFSGLTTKALCGVLNRVIVEHPALTGVFHVSAQPITKYDLLTRLGRQLGLDDIGAADEPAIDRSLDGSRFVEATGIRTPSWDEMILDLAEQVRLYDSWKAGSAVSPVAGAPPEMDHSRARVG